MQQTLRLHIRQGSFIKLIYGLLYPPLLLEFTATHSSESIKQLAAGVSGFFSQQLLCSTAPEKGAENNHAGLKGRSKPSLYFLFSSA